MKIREIIIERNDVDKIGNDRAIIARTAKQASKTFIDADRGALDRPDDVRKLLTKVGSMYGVELVDDYLDVLEKPNGEHDTDNEKSLLSKDNRS